LQLTEKDENIMTMSTLSPQPYKGTRDWYPEDKRVQNYIFGVWKKTAGKFGYEEYGAPLLEPIEVYAAKSGQELVGEQTYRFIDRGDREVAIRPEMTPTISRMVAARRQELAYPARLFSIANFMRYERPQKGREREFWQLNVDIFGADTIYADAEIISFGSMVMKEFGASEDMFTIRVNDRRVINATMHEYLGLDEVQAQLMTKLFDRKSKISPEDFRDQAIEILGEEKAPAGLQKIAELINAKSVDSLPKELQTIEAMAGVKTLFDILKNAGVKNAVFDITLMRGLDYYTGTVFEFFDNNPENNRSLFGGGRYDGLVGLFGAEPISAVGVAPGLTTTEIFLRLHDLLPKLTPSTEMYLVILSEDTLDDALVLARKWREEGLAVEVDITCRKLDKQIKTAVKKQIPFMVFIGENELKNDIYTLKDVASAEEQQLSFERVVSVVKDRRRKTGDDDLENLLD